MKETLVTSVIFFGVLVVAVIYAMKFNQRDNFDAAGLVFNVAPNWFQKAAYNPQDWVVSYNPDQISQPECMHWRGPNQDLNYMSSAYRFWRM